MQSVFIHLPVLTFYFYVSIGTSLNVLPIIGISKCARKVMRQTCKPIRWFRSANATLVCKCKIQWGKLANPSYTVGLQMQFQFVKITFSEADSQTHPMNSICKCILSLQIQFNVANTLFNISQLTLARALPLANANHCEVTTTGQSAWAAMLNLTGQISNVRIS